VSKENPKRLLGVNFTDDEFHLLNGHARKHKMPVREFVEYMVHCYINSMQKQQQGKAR